MADAYVDLEQTASTATSPYETWAKAAADMQTAITQAGVGGRVFVRIDGDGVGTTEDATVGNVTLTFPGTDQVPFGLYGVKDATTAAPPTDSDLCVRGTDILPVLSATITIIVDEATGSSGVHVNITGISFQALGDFRLGATTTFVLNDCEILGDDLSLHQGVFNNCEIEFEATNSDLITDKLMVIGGKLTTASDAGGLIDGSPLGLIEFYGVDLSDITGVFLDIGGVRELRVRIVNCKLATGFTRIVGIAATSDGFIEVINSSDETGLGSGEAVRSYAKEWYKGTVLDEATFVRAGGVSDGVANWSYALTPRTASTKEGLLSIETPWFGGIVEGDATTSKDFTIYISNSSGADLTKADVWVEILYPSETGTTDHGFDQSSRTAIDASAADVTDDTASDWSTGAGGKNAQKIVITKTPDFTGPVYARVHFAQAGTNTLYVDPKVYVTDT